MNQGSFSLRVLNAAQRLFLVTSRCRAWSVAILLLILRQIHKKHDWKFCMATPFSSPFHHQLWLQLYVSIAHIAIFSQSLIPSSFLPLPPQLFKFLSFHVFIPSHTLKFPPLHPFISKFPSPLPFSPLISSLCHLCSLNQYSDQSSNHQALHHLTHLLTGLEP